jgi:hypothetical protein
MLSNEVKKFLRFPTKAIPLGPTNTANNFEVTNPIPIFKMTLKLFKDEILNSCVWVIFLTNSNLILV